MPNSKTSPRPTPIRLGSARVSVSTCIAGLLGHQERRYELVSGLGTPIGNILVPQLIAGGFLNLGLASAAGTINVRAGDSINQELASFRDPNGQLSPGSYTATINWGDGTTSSVTLSADAVGNPAVYGQHRYAKAGVYTINLDVHSPRGPDAGATVTAAVTQPPVQITGNDPVDLAAVYRAVLGADPQPGELESWAAQIDGGLDRGAFVNSLDHIASYFATIIGPAYQQYLGRAADSAGLAYWIQQMQAGLTDEQLEAKFIGSPEFYQAAGGTDADWVEALYQHLLSRGADPQGEAWWTNALANGHSRAEVALEFTASSEREKQRVQDDYFHYLGRQASPSEADFWLNNLENGQTNEDLITGFLTSPEYYQHHTS